MRYRIRTLLFIVIPLAAVFACVTPWYLTILKEQDVVHWVVQQNGHVGYYQDQTHQRKSPLSMKPWFGTRISSIVLDNREIDDLTPLLGARKLRSLGIYIDLHPDVELQHLAKINSLEELTINYTQLTTQQRNQIKELRQSLPNCVITIGHDVSSW